MPLDFSQPTAVDGSDSTIKSILEPLARAALNVYFPERDEKDNPSLSRFFLENGRLPFITDEIKPWHYRGWLIPYLQMSEAHPRVPKRYDYVLRTLDAGRLLNEPLPQIEFVGEFEAAVKPGIKMLNTCLETVEYKSGSWNGMREFCEWLGFALGVTTEPAKLEPDVQEFLYRNFSLEHLLLHPSDYLGQLLCETSYGKKNGFYPTPINICEMMVRMVSGDAGGDRRSETVHDPCVGTGRMLLVASNYSMRLFGQDIDYLCCLITKINLALYAPWFYIPESFYPQREEKTVSLPENTQETSSRPPAANLTTLFDMQQLDAGNSQTKGKRQKAGKKYSVEIEQPSLFDFEI